MAKMELKLSKIGNSHGVRLPAVLLKKYRFGRTIVLEEAPNALILRAKEPGKLTWKETAAEMALQKEEWSAFDPAAADGLDEL